MRVILEQRGSIGALPIAVDRDSEVLAGLKGVPGFGEPT